MLSIGAADQKAQFVAFVVLIKCLEAKTHHFFDIFTALITRQEIWRFLQQMTKLITYTCAWGNDGAVWETTFYKIWSFF